MFRIKDAQRSIKFYTEILGMELSKLGPRETGARVLTL